MCRLKFVFIVASALALAALQSPRAVASDGETDFANKYPAAAGYFEYYVVLTPGEAPEVQFAELSCSGALVSDKVVMTAAHCTAWNYVQEIGITGYFDLAWVSFDAVATANDFRCFLKEENVPYAEFMTGKYACDPAARTKPRPTFRKAAVAGVTDGVPIAHGLTHPGFLQPELNKDGLAVQADANLQNAADLGVVILESPVPAGKVAPLDIRWVGELDTFPDLKGTPVVSVGYGLNWTKAYGKGSAGLGPQTDLGGDSEKRIAFLGPLQAVHTNSLLPRQDPKKGDNTVCFGDSGSPLFLVENGETLPVVSGVLSGWTNWCQGSKDPYYRIDQQAAHDFLGCVIANQDDVRQACTECSAEQNFGLCDGL